jgi:hypothetical protein
MTYSADFPLMNALQSSFGARALEQQQRRSRVDRSRRSAVRNARHPRGRSNRDGYAPTDGGATWTPIAQPKLNANAVTALTLDSSSGVLFAAGLFPDVGMFVSADKGATWQAASGSPVAGPQGRVPQINALMTASGTLYAILQNTQASAGGRDPE